MSSSLTTPQQDPLEADFGAPAQHQFQPEDRKAKFSRFSFKSAPYAFVAPFFIIFAAVGLYPLFYSLWASFTDLSLAGNTKDGFIGLANYEAILTGSQSTIFWPALINTFSIFIISTVPQIIFATVLATLLDRNLRARTFWRMGVLLPYVVAPAAVGLIFGAIFANPNVGNGGMANGLLGLVGLDPINWQAERWWSHFAIANMVNYRWTGYNALLLLAAMQAVPRDLYEAAALDGAGPFRRFFSVTLPSIRGTMTFVVVQSTIGGLRIFDEPRMFSGNSLGGTNNVYRTVVLFMHDTMFGKLNMGRASAIAWVMFIVIVIISALNLFLTSKIADENPKALKRKAAKRAARRVKEERA